ncbi:HD-GYP domain-containing protein [Paenibacillus sp. KN14-4R]|uniref:HD-GYP domain-containing protein n=1 Tax=Paenibacillus sp. KN14-4R TaxID=3445773 RepID=UPI003FA093D1
MNKLINQIDTEKSVSFSPSLDQWIEQATKYSEDMFERVKRRQKLPLLEIKQELLPLVQEAAEVEDIFQLFALIRAKDDYIHQHNIGVGILATRIGKWMEISEKELALLSLSATLHDIGKVRISDDILLKPTRLTNEETAEMRRHTIYGYELLRGTIGLHQRVAQVALQHHERGDGGGYPLHLNNSQIDPFSRIVAVADTFHAMLSDRPYHKALPFQEIIYQIRNGAFGAFDPQVTAVFLRKMIGCLVGRPVKLSDDREGEIVFIHPHDEMHPLVKIGNDFVDLSEQRDLYIREVLIE